MSDGAKSWQEEIEDRKFTRTITALDGSFGSRSPRVFDRKRVAYRRV